MLSLLSSAAAQVPVASAVSILYKPNAAKDVGRKE